MKESINNVFDTFLDSRLEDIHTILPGEIVSYQGHNERKATVKPLVKLRTHLNKISEIQPIDSVPVIFPSTKQFNFLFPLNKGDGVLLLFSEAGIGNYLASTTVQDADDLRRFDLSDCIAIPGMWSFKNTPTNTNTNIEIGDDGSILLESTLGKIKIEASGNITMDDGTEPFVLGTTLDTWITATLLTIFNAHTHTSASPGSPTSTPSSPLTPPINYLSNFIKGK